MAENRFIRILVLSGSRNQSGEEMLRRRATRVEERADVAEEFAEYVAAKDREKQQQQQMDSQQHLTQEQQQAQLIASTRQNTRARLGL